MTERDPIIEREQEQTQRELVAQCPPAVTEIVRKIVAGIYATAVREGDRMHIPLQLPNIHQLVALVHEVPPDARVAMQRAFARSRISGVLLGLIEEYFYRMLAAETCGIVQRDVVQGAFCEHYAAMRRALPNAMSWNNAMLSDFKTSFPNVEGRPATSVELGVRCRTPETASDAMRFADDTGDMMQRAATQVFQALEPHMYEPRAPDATDGSGEHLSAGDISDIREVLHLLILMQRRYEELSMEFAKTKGIEIEGGVLDASAGAGIGAMEALLIRYLQRRFPAFTRRDEVHQEGVSLRRRIHPLVAITNAVKQEHQRLVLQAQGTPNVDAHVITQFTAVARTMLERFGRALDNLTAMNGLAETIHTPPMRRRPGEIEFPTTAVPTLAAFHILLRKVGGKGDISLVMGQTSGVQYAPSLTRNLIAGTDRRVLIEQQGVFTPREVIQPHVGMHTSRGKTTLGNTSFVPLENILPADSDVMSVACGRVQDNAGMLMEFMMDQVRRHGLTEQLERLASGMRGVLFACAETEEGELCRLFLLHKNDAERLQFPEPLAAETPTPELLAMLKALGVPIPEAEMVIVHLPGGDDGDDEEEKDAPPDPDPVRLRNPRLVTAS